MADLAQQIQLVPPTLPRREEQTTYHGDARTEAGPEMLQNIAEQRAVEQEQANVIARDTEHQQKVATAESALAKEQADEMGRQMERKAKVEAQAGKDIESWKGNLNKAYTEAIRAPMPALFHGGNTTVQDILRAFGMFMMAVRDAGTDSIAVQQGRAPGAHQLHDFIASDLAAQRENVRQLQDRVVMARTGLKDAQEAREQMLAQVDARGAAVYKRLEALARARLSAMKVDQKAIEGDARVQELAAEGVKQRQNSVAGLTRKIESPSKTITNRDPSASSTKPTEAQGKNALFGQQILDELDTLSRLPPVPGDVAAKYQQNVLDMEAAQESATSGVVGNLATRGLRGIGALPKSQFEGIDPKHAQALNSFEAAKEKMVHLLTGAGMTNTEDVRKTMIHFPGPSDPPDVQRLKMQRFEATARQILSLAGPAADQVAGAARPSINSPVLVGPSAKDPTAVAPSRGRSASPEDINSEAPLPEDPQAQSIDELQSKAPAPKPAPAPVKPEVLTPEESRRDKAIRMLRANPNAKGAQTIRRLYNITDEDLRGGN